MLEFQDMYAELFDLESDMEKYEWIMDYGDRRLNLPRDYWTDENLVRGCTSALWLARIGDQYWTVGASLIVNGLAGMIVDWYNQADADSRQQLSVNMLAETGLMPILSMGRQNGVANLIARLKHYEQ